MSDETYYITPHEAALAVVATSMKKARLRLDTLIINSIVGGVLFSAGGMLHLCAEAENPDLWKTNPGIVHFMQGLVYPIGLFYVVVMGADLFNSNILYFSVGFCRGAVSILDLLISWSVSWFCNLGANLFVCYVICHLSGITRSDTYVTGSIEIAMDKIDASFIETFIGAIAANFCVCLAVYLQLMAKPLHVKFFLMGLPVFTFVTMGFNHAVADMYLVPMGMFNGAPLSVGKLIWKNLIPVALGNSLGGSIFGIVIPWYSHLVVVERDRRLLNLPQFEAKDEQPELEMDSRVVRVPTEKEEEFDSSDFDEQNNNDNYNPVSYRPQPDRRFSRTSKASGSLSRIPTGASALSHRSLRSVRSPPGVFPVLGMGEPLSREKSIASRQGNDLEIDSDDPINSPDNMSLDSDRDSVLDNVSTRSRRLNTQEKQKLEEEEYKREGGYNARENNMSENLRKVFTRKPSSERDIESVFEQSTTPHKSQSSMLRNLSRSFTQRQPSNAHDFSRRLSSHSITPRAANASDNIAGIDNYDIRDAFRPPSMVHRPSSVKTNESKIPIQKLRNPTPVTSHDNDNSEQQSVTSNVVHDN